jgi:hypothetical protein
MCVCVCGHLVADLLFAPLSRWQCHSFEYPWWPFLPMCIPQVVHDYICKPPAKNHSLALAKATVVFFFMLRFSLPCYPSWRSTNQSTLACTPEVPWYFDPAFYNSRKEHCYVKAALLHIIVSTYVILVLDFWPPCSSRLKASPELLTFFELFSSESRITQKVRAL